MNVARACYFAHNVNVLLLISTHLHIYTNITAAAAAAAQSIIHAIRFVEFLWYINRLVCSSFCVHVDVCRTRI